ncbi:fibropellin-1-like [Ruditapes philippinarum]|uniref:fibropellin-1-like n=1 Tax=Ruditapes philippinarum TaxID=129788 RepID=UPI00295BE118|nr:fibropellin-1-like [Ruditapes philippinarum]
MKGNLSLRLIWCFALISLEKVLSRAQNHTVCGNVTCSLNARGCLSNGVCNCLVGSWGDDCNKDRDECRAHTPPCGHTGHCVNTPGSYKCTCLKGWNGEHCTNRSASVNVECMPGWTGNTCDKDIDECQNGSSLCPGVHRLCSNNQGSYKCLCDVGWEGQSCSQDIDECVKLPCKNQGTCVNTPGSYNCNCAAGWGGKNCINDTDECLNTPCANKGTCINVAGSFTCTCATGWQGFLCDKDIDECQTVSCMTNERCINMDGSYSCICNNGWHGLHCVDDVNECLVGTPCGPNGVCNNTIGSFKCQCKQGWQGPMCDSTINGKDDPMAIGTIVGIVVGCAIAVGGLFALAFLIRYMWRLNRVEEDKNGVEVISVDHQAETMVGEGSENNSPSTGQTAANGKSNVQDIIMKTKFSMRKVVS